MRASSDASRRLVFIRPSPPGRDSTARDVPARTPRSLGRRGLAGSNGHSAIRARETGRHTRLRRLDWVVRRTLAEAAAVSRRAASSRRLVARRELSLRRADLPARQPAAARAASPRAREAAPARPLGHLARAELRL